MRVLPTLSLLATAAVSVLAQQTETSTAPGTQSTSDSDSDCPAQNILDACVDSISGQLDDCGANEWDCLCTQTENLLTCYNNCPNDPARYGINQQRTSYCNAADQLSTTTTSTSATTTSARTSTATETESATSTSDGAAVSETADDRAGRLEVGLGVGLGLAAMGVLV
ncbi:GPI anchored serine-threonine rich protein [Aspergillus undulatus]|uniref:GPI anchored serine-threonine rich protein n=1 Tax=Aspergillus undulatus TaxID=1810928 RepID=UPI003CCCD8B5